MDIEAIWLRRIGDRIEVLINPGAVPGEWKWFLVISENADGAFSHIAERPAIDAAPADPWREVIDEGLHRINEEVKRHAKGLTVDWRNSRS